MIYFACAFFLAACFSAAKVGDAMANGTLNALWLWVPLSLTAIVAAIVALMASIRNEL